MISINVNSAASASGLTLGKTNEALQKSMERLSSGSRIINSSDDAGGLAVSMKMSAALKRTEATSINLSNAQSFLQTQDGAFKTATAVVTRMSELATLALDTTKNDSDVANYNMEFQNLIAELNSLATEKFNGISLFNNPGTLMTVSTSEDGSQTTGMTQSGLLSTSSGVGLIVAMTGTNGLNKTTSVGINTELQNALQNVAALRAQNGSESSRITFAQDVLKINAINLEAANSRIIDVDVAAESTQLARFQILQQAGTAMLAQANTSQQNLVKLLQG
jgi:flagellin